MKTHFHTIVGLGFVLLGAMVCIGARAQEILPLDPAKALTQYHLDTWTAEDGLPQNSITALTQTRDGYLWLGTQEGLVRFDGLRFQVFDKRAGALPNNHVTALLEDQSGALWIGTRGGGLIRMRDGQYTTFTTQNGLVSNQISSLLQDRTGTLWIGTFDAGISQLRHDRFSDTSGTPFIAFNQELAGGPINTLFEDRSGTIWIGTRETGLLRFQERRITSYTTDDGLGDEDVTALFETRTGSLWIGTRGAGLSFFEAGQFISYTSADGLPDDKIFSLFEDTAGSLWIGTERSGLCRLRSEHVSCLATTDGLNHSTVRVLYGDREGSLWIGTDGGGLHRLRDGKFTTYTTKEGLANDFVYTVYEDRYGAIWMGTEEGITRFEKGILTSFTTRDGLSDNFVLSIYGTRDGSLWLGTNGGGLNRWKNGRFSTYSTDDGLPHNTVWALYEDAQGTLWVSTLTGLTRFRDGQFMPFTTTDGLSSDEITAFTEDPTGTLWMGTYTGELNRIKDGRVLEKYTEKHGLANNAVLDLHADAQGTIWFSTLEGGLHRLRDGQLTSFTTHDGLFNDTIYRILEDRRGNLWLTSSQGLFVLSKQQLDAYARHDRAVLTPTVYDQSDGLKSREFMGGPQPAGWRSRDGKLWLPTVKGTAMIDPAHLRHNARPPQVLIERAAANNETIPLTGTASLQAGQDKFEFHYVGLSLLVPEKVRYRYMLEGVDETWVDAGPRREAYYTNLKPGSYTFKVIASNNDGVWSEQEATVSFYLRPYFHQTPLFYALCALGLLLATFIIYRLRVRRLKQREKELVQLVEARTRDLRQEKERTELALQETEKARREAEQQKDIAENAKAVIEEQAVKLQEMSIIKTRFFNNISHEFRTPLTLNIGPLENALMGAYGPVNDDLKKQLEVMLRNSRLLLRLINQLLDVAKLESGNMGLHMRRGNLAELLEGVVLSFTAFAERKSITLDFSAEHDPLSFNFDPSHLEKVFFNLLSNAVKFTPEQGRVTVSTYEGALGANGVEGETVIIRFKDTGPGIPAEDASYIFDRFHQVDGTISKVQEGTGIGLALVKELVELHGGTIRVESEVGAGSEFIVTLPKDIRQLDVYSEDDESWEPIEAVSLGPMVEMAVFDDSYDTTDPADETAPTLPPDAPTILVVDDNPEIRAYVADCLKHTYRVVEACDGLDALEKAAEFHPDLITSDVMMPNLDGYGLCRAVKSDKSLSHIPIILLTSRASLDEKIKGLESGCDDYLTKPFSARELLGRSRNLLHLGMQKRELKALNEALKQTNAELREVSQMKSQLLRIAAHDLKNPLNGIREFAKILKDEIAPHASSQELLDLIETSSDQMLNMVGEILDSEVLESGEVILETESVSLCEIAEEVIRRNRPQAERKGEKLLLWLDENDPCLVEGSREWLRDAMDNLVSNAVKYSPFNKTIWVTVKKRGSIILFSVRDEGPGLTEGDKKKLFGKFQRLSATPTNNESSTGLGLSIVKQIVELHGGRVWAESTLGAGSTFIIELSRTSGGGSAKGHSVPPSRKGGTSSISGPAEAR